MTPDDGEAVVLETRPHGRALVGPVLVLLVTAGLGGFLAARAGSGPHPGALRLAVAVGAVVVLLPLAVLPWLRWWSTRVLLTDRRVALHEGVLRRRARDVPLVRVAEVAVRQTAAQRLQGCGTLLVRSGDGPALAVPVLADVQAVRRELGRRVAAAHAARQRPDRG